MSASEEREAELVDQELRLQLDAFDPDAAWRLGVALRELAAAGSMPVAIRIASATGALLFHASLPGATVDNDAWAERKAAVVLRFEMSSARFGDRWANRPAHPLMEHWVDPARFAPVGGAFPIRVRGAGIVAVVAVSGLPDDGDHRLIVAALEAASVHTDEQPLREEAR